MSEPAPDQHALPGPLQSTAVGTAPTCRAWKPAQSRGFWSLVQLIADGRFEDAFLDRQIAQPAGVGLRTDLFGTVRGRLPAGLGRRSSYGSVLSSDSSLRSSAPNRHGPDFFKLLMSDPQADGVETASIAGCRRLWHLDQLSRRDHNTEKTAAIGWRSSEAVPRGSGVPTTWP